MSQESSCRHEYVKLFQRKLKGLERRLVATRAFLPVGFRQGDLGHLGEGSYAFCTRCRARLHPRRTQAEKAAARQALLAGKAQAEAEREEELMVEAAPEREITPDINVEELELEAVDVQDIEAEGVKLSDEEGACQLECEE